MTQRNDFNKQSLSHNIDLFMYMNIHVCTVADHTRLCIPKIHHPETKQTTTHRF